MPQISEEVRRLIAEHITSVEQLEILLLMRAEPERTWTADQVNERIRSSLISVNTRLADLQAHGFVREEAGGFRYDPVPGRAAAVDALATAYADFRFSIIELIFAKPTDKTQVFARAFKIRRDDDG